MEDQERLRVVQRLFAKGLKYNSDNMGFYLRPSEELNALQLAQVSECTTLQDVYWKICIFNLVRLFNFETHNWRVSGLDFELNQYAQTKLSLSGGSVAGERFTLTLWNVSIAPPVVLDSDQEKEANSIWLLTGGFTNERGGWVSVPEFWFESVYFSQREGFLFKGETGDALSFTCSANEAGDITISLGFGDHALFAMMRNHDLPIPVQNDVSSSLFRQTNYLYSNMTVEFAVDANVLRDGFGFAQISRSLSPSTQFSEQGAWVARQRVYAPNLNLFLRMQDVQYVAVFPVHFGSLPAGTLLEAPLEAFAIRDHRSERVRSLRVAVTSSRAFGSEQYPTALQIYIDDNQFLVGTAGDACDLVLNASVQSDFQAVLVLEGTQQQRGIGLLRINNVLSPEKWSELSFGDATYAALLMDQPVVRKRWLAQLLYYWPFTMVIPLAIVALLLGIFLH